MQLIYPSIVANWRLRNKDEFSSRHNVTGRREEVFQVRKFLKIQEALNFFQGKAKLIEPNIAPIIEGDNEVRPIVVPQVDDTQPTAVRAEQMRVKRDIEKDLNERIAKKLEVCILFKTYSDNSFRNLVKTKPLVEAAFNDGNIPVVMELWKEWFNNVPVAAAAGT